MDLCDVGRLGNLVPVAVQSCCLVDTLPVRVAVDAAAEGELRTDVELDSEVPEFVVLGAEGEGRVDNEDRVGRQCDVCRAVVLASQWVVCAQGDLAAAFGPGPVPGESLRAAAKS